MIYLIFFILCVALVAGISLTVSVRGRALAFATVCAGVALLAEIYGIRNESWNYASVDSIFTINGVPIEILFGYFTGGFLLVIIVSYLPRISTEVRRKEAIQLVILVTGVVLLAYAYAYQTLPILVGWSLLGIYGLSVTRDTTIPLMVGMGALLADWAVESTLTTGVEYYSNGWNASIGLVFMFAGMFISGVLTHEWLRHEGADLDGVRDPLEGPMPARSRAAGLLKGGSLTSVFSQVFARKP